VSIYRVTPTNNLEGKEEKTMISMRYFFIAFMLAVVSNNQAYTMKVINLMPDQNYFMSNPFTKAAPSGGYYLVWGVLADDRAVLLSMVPYGSQVSLTYPGALKNVYVVPVGESLNSGSNTLSFTTKDAQNLAKIGPTTEDVAARALAQKAFDQTVIAAGYGSSMLNPGDLPADGGLLYIVPVDPKTGYSGSGKFLASGSTLGFGVADKNINAYWQRAKSATFSTPRVEIMKLGYFNQLISFLQMYSLPTAGAISVRNAIRAPLKAMLDEVGDSAFMINKLACISCSTSLFKQTWLPQINSTN
jgi:hypothetical protein